MGYSAICRFAVMAVLAMVLSGCTAIIEHFDGKAQAWEHCVENHAKKHPECGENVYCKRLGHDIGPGTVLP